MKSAAAKGGIELAEEAASRLRRLPSRVWATYYLGALPFVLGLLYFWADMSRSPFAHQHLAGAAFGLALLFGWMKTWQAIFARQLRSALAAAPLPPLSARACGRIFVAQTALQPTGLVLLPLALLPVVPFAWVFAFYQNLTALADGEAGGLRPLAARALRQARLWPSQNLALLAIVFGFGFCVFLNWVTVGFALPFAVKALFGVESAFTRSPLSLLNTTFFAVVFALTYLSVDPIVKTAYALRCFHGEALKSGEDLRAELRALAPGTARGLSALVVFLATATPVFALAAAHPQPEGRTTEYNAEPGVSAGSLDRSIQEVIGKSKYTWRMPREKIVEEASAGKGIFGRFFERTIEWLENQLEKVARWMGKWLRRLFESRRAPGADSSYRWILVQEILVFLLICAAVAALVYVVYRFGPGSRRRTPVLAGEPLQPAPDLADENVGADQLPEEGWTQLARELLARGELRLALRAFYLASLAHLAKRNLITLAKFKSNRDYERELARRGHAFGEVPGWFGKNVAVFDRTWYGLHEINADLVREFAANVERIRSRGGAEP